MKILPYILSITVFFTTLPTVIYAQVGPGAGEDPFYECRPRGENDTALQDQRVKTLEEQIRVQNESIKTKDTEFTQAKAELEEASKRVQNTSKDNRDSSVMDAKQAAIEKVRRIENELKNLRAVQTVYTEDLANAQATLQAIQERDRLTNSSIEIFNLTSGELDKNSIGGSIAETALQLMALSTSAVNHLNCRPSSDTDAASYAIFKAAASVYLTNNIGSVMDYENLAECVTKKALSPTEKKDVQYSLIKRARDLFNEMANHVTAVTDSTESDLELFNKALEYATNEWSKKIERVETKHGAMLTAKQNWDDAWNWQFGVKMAAIALSVAIFWVPHLIPVMIGLWAWWGADLRPKEIRTKKEYKKSLNELRVAHQHTALNCNYGEAKRWDLAKELRDMETYLAAKKRAEQAKKAELEARILLYKKLEQEQENEREGSEAKPTGYIFKPILFNTKITWIDLFIESVFAQDEALLGETLTKIKDSMANQQDSQSRIPNFTPGTPEGARVVADLKRQYELKKQAYDSQALLVSKMYERMEAYMADYNDYASKFGDVAAKNPEIKCTYEWPIVWYRGLASAANPPSNWDQSPAGRAMNELWRTKGCSTDNKNTMEGKQKTMEDYYNSIAPFEEILNAYERNMDQAELDYLTAQQINEGTTGDPLADRLNPQSVTAAAYADFLGKIKGEWKTSSMNTEKDNFILVDRTSTWTLEKLLNEHPTIKNIAPNKKAGFGDAYTRYVYIQYAVDLVIKNLNNLARAKSQALGQALAYQELLSQADVKLNLDALALPTVSRVIAKNKGCMKSEGGSSSADPSCSCKAKGTCSKFSFPAATLSGSSKDLSSGLIEDYANNTFSANEGARMSGNAVKRNAAATRKSIEETKSTILEQRKSTGFENTNIENMSNMVSSSIQGDARRSAAAAISTKSSTGRLARILALEKKVTPENVQAAFAATVKPSGARKVAPQQKKPTLEMGELSIDESGTGTEGEMELETMDFGSTTGTKKDTKPEAAQVSEDKPAGVEYDPSKTLWKNISKRYQKSAFPRLLKKKKVE